MGEGSEGAGGGAEGDFEVLGYVRFLNDKARMIEDGGEIGEASGGEVVEDGDVSAGRKEEFDEVGADKSGTAGDEDVVGGGGVLGIGVLGRGRGWGW